MIRWLGKLWSRANGRKPQSVRPPSPPVVLPAPRLTIGIPTQGKRPERLDVAIGSALAQQYPVRVLVSCQGPAENFADLRERYAAHPLVRFVDSPATCLWENWTHAAEMCDTEIFAWLQDDDVVAPHFSRRVVYALDGCPKAATYLARLGIGHSGDLANWWQATGPLVPMDLLRGSPQTLNPALMALGAYFTSHALSPGVAFRVTPEALACVRGVPKNADLFAERSIVAELSKLGGAVCDPAIVGYWVQHEGNESKSQNAAGDGDRQYRVMLQHLRPIVESYPGRLDALRGWALLVGPDIVRQWHTHASPFRADCPLLGEAMDTFESLHPELRPKVEPEKPRAAEPEAAVNGRALRAEKAISRR